ncbi:putative conserved protein YndB, AHSA1/START domain [Abditibacterium utsteinense]|uniref:Putative conserved protein YndB, AHSA1/START domain n=1 Tax=Abditibacterium utsteinense TaxID=1960156 RepID=A0A2S8STR0_9BACT|nr:SRPBCC domain-containing protein [Abditibacterium utsteinense]PQV64129.1 putative conserved protein YndB, AHSA1/START domain [Abditibacterium utsteinense]
MTATRSVPSPTPASSKQRSSGTTTPQAANQHELVFTRLIDAPKALVFQAWTQREHLMRWCAPQGFAITYCEGEARPGGAWRTCMVSPAGIEHWVSGVYREFVPDEKLVFTHIWDAEEGLPAHETLVTVDLADEGQQTRLRFRQEHLRSAESRSGHEIGWSESFERLTGYLSEVQTANG